jgi:hypothetical protein
MGGRLAQGGMLQFNHPRSWIVHWLIKAATASLQALMGWNTDGPLGVRPHIYLRLAQTDVHASFRKYLTSSYQLYLNADPTTIVAKYRKQHIGATQHGSHVVAGPTVATLEISEQGEHMADLIVITLAYIEKLRRESQAV